MAIPVWLKKYMQDSDLKRIQDEIAEAEKKTTVEIVPMVVHRSTPIGHVWKLLLLFWFFALALLVLWLPYFSFISVSSNALQALEVGLLLFSVVFAYLFSRIERIQRWLTSRDDQDLSVQRRAQLEFYQAHVDKTKGGTGILIFVSRLEHQVVILADKAIAEKLPAETWNGLVQSFVQRIREKQFAEGMVEAVRLCGQIVEKHFPSSGENKDELSNKLIIKE